LKYKQTLRRISFTPNYISSSSLVLILFFHGQTTTDIYLCVYYITEGSIRWRETCRVCCSRAESCIFLTLQSLRPSSHLPVISRIECRDLRIIFTINFIFINNKLWGAEHMTNEKNHHIIVATTTSTNY
jgi:hypothetical protein